MNLYSRGDVVLVDLSNGTPNSTSQFVSPAVVISSDTLNANLDTLIVCPIVDANGISESRIGATFLPQDVTGLGKNSIILSFQIRSIDRNRIIRRVGSLPALYMEQVQDGVSAALELH
ncbi:MAG: type II toxin-antitoxin system PemK/MazF family toxin [Deferribacteres bacterium]|nr:type II toxin-antitoxin system PemK/MazF family toxin [candidate division KSB1 bacterium]MCB9500370.1 type II toxin-antitoxin system PemK/MazF family toxin [Deferribacteres bacterium]